MRLDKLAKTHFVVIVPPGTRINIHIQHHCCSHTHLVHNTYTNRYILHAPKTLRRELVPLSSRISLSVVRILCVHGVVVSEILIVSSLDGLWFCGFSRRVSKGRRREEEANRPRYSRRISGDFRFRSFRVHTLARVRRPSVLGRRAEKHVGRGFLPKQQLCSTNAARLDVRSLEHTSRYRQVRVAAHFESSPRRPANSYPHEHRETGLYWLQQKLRRLHQGTFKSIFRWSVADRIADINFIFAAQYEKCKSQVLRWTLFQLPVANIIRQTRCKR